MNNSRFKLLLKEAKKLNSSLICDVGKDKVINLSNYFTNYSKDYDLIGPISIVKTEGSILPILEGLSTIKESYIMFIHDLSPKKALLGDIIMLDAKYRKLSGIICSGLIRDIEAQSKIKLPIWAKGVTPFAANLGKRNYDNCEVINFNGVEIEDEDWIFGDEDGIVLIKKNDARFLIKSASIKKKKEDKYIKRIHDGEDIVTMMKIREYLNNESKILVEF